MKINKRVVVKEKPLNNNQLTLIIEKEGPVVEDLNENSKRLRLPWYKLKIPIDHKDLMIKQKLKK